MIEIRSMPAEELYLLRKPERMLVWIKGSVIAEVAEVDIGNKCIMM